MRYHGIVEFLYSERIKRAEYVRTAVIFPAVYQYVRFAGTYQCAVTLSDIYKIHIRDAGAGKRLRLSGIAAEPPYHYRGKRDKQNYDGQQRPNDFSFCRPLAYYAVFRSFVLDVLLHCPRPFFLREPPVSDSRRRFR